MINKNKVPKEIIMKRREFIRNTILTAGGTVLLSGCGKNEIIQREGNVAKRKFKDIEVPLLGFGCMRFPMKNEKVDFSELELMTDYAISHGANYFDTAYMYVGGKSEESIGKVLKNYKREDIIIADKSPAIFMHSKEDVRKIFDEQLKRCQTDYFDFYMVHNINKNTIDNYKNFDMYNQIMKFKKEGKVKYVGFSFHGDPKMLKTVAAEHPWDFCQLQVNWLDWDVVKAKEQYDIARENNIPVTVMEPLRGGALCNLPENAAVKLKEIAPNDTQPAFGLKWAASRENVITVLSGMSNLQQMKENIATFEKFEPVTEKQDEQIKDVVKIVQSQGEINCTACKYCMEVCPLGINIPAAFSLYNQYKSTQNKLLFSIYYDSLSENERPDKCIKCGLCNKNCPQNLNIPELLAKIDEEYKTIQ